MGSSNIPCVSRRGERDAGRRRRGFQMIRDRMPLEALGPQPPIAHIVGRDIRVSAGFPKERGGWLLDQGKIPPGLSRLVRPLRDSTIAETRPGLSAGILVISPCVYSDPQTRELRLDLDRLIHPWCDKTAASESSGPAGKAGRPPPSSPGRGRLPPGSGTQSTFQTAHVRCAAARPAGWEAEAGHHLVFHTWHSGVHRPGAGTKGEGIR